jgi:branched-chain amino acid transport system ATP-binding protein
MSPLLEVRDLRITYGGVVAVGGVDLAVGEAAVVGLIGPNGAGKTSMIDGLTGYHLPSAGTVRFAGDDLTRMRPHLRARRGMVRTFQSVELFDDLTVQENLQVAADDLGVTRALGAVFRPARARGRDDVAWALGVCGLQDEADARPAELSHGRRKLVGVARALARRPRLVLLDEPAAGLDTEESLELGRRLAVMPGEGVSVLLVDHDMGLVLGTCEDIYVLDFGKLIAHGTPARIRQDPAVLTAYLGTEEVAHA